MAFAGVLMGRQKARPAGTATAKVVTIGFIPKALPRLNATGRIHATAATLLMPSVKRMLAKLIVKIKRYGERILSPIKILANHDAAPVISNAEPSAIAPPYIRIIPQLI